MSMRQDFKKVHNKEPLTDNVNSLIHRTRQTLLEETIRVELSKIKVLEQRNNNIYRDIDKRKKLIRENINKMRSSEFRIKDLQLSINNRNNIQNGR